MTNTWSVEMGERGRLVIPREARGQQHWETGSKLVAISSDLGVTLIEQSRLHELVAAQLSNRDLVAELMAERRAAAQAEDRS
ncbi:MAG: AbrB/MazE/SpoVT family DNA-binding domain-containing protein [Microbacteriaceae bacterium]